MPGPAPKPASQRRRRNAQAGLRVLAAEGRVGPTPALGSKKPAWLKSTREWWATIWASPMATVWLEADVPTLRRLARLVDTEARGLGDPTVRAEIRHLEDRFGLSPLARRRLQWEIQQATASQKDEPSTRATRYGHLRVAVDDG